MADLKTDFKDDIYQGNRKYLQTKNEDGTVSFSDATQYEQEGDYFGANEINAISQAVNEAQNKADQAFQSASNGKEVIKTAIAGKDPSVTIPTDATFAQLVAAIGQIETGVNTDDATATAEYLLAGLTMYVKGLKITGTMPAKTGAENPATYRKSGVAGKFYLKPPKGYYDGTVEVNHTDVNFIAENIKPGVSTLGITGNMASKGAATITPGTTDQFIAAQQYLTGVQTIKGDANLISANILQGKNIFGVAGSAVQGKRWASGVSDTSVSGAGFDYVEPHPVSGSVTATMRYVIVLGLNFTPSYILVTGQHPSISKEQVVTIYDTFINRYYPKTFICFSISSSYVSDVTYCVKADTRLAYVNNTGFLAPISAPAGSQVRWIAIE